MGLLVVVCLTTSVAAAVDVEIISRQVAVQNYCAWPNITRLPDGSLAAIVFNKPVHARTEGEIECWTSREGVTWTKAGTPVTHDPQANRLNTACGLNRRGELVVLCSGWTLKANAASPTGWDLVESIRICSSISADGGRTWAVRLYAVPPARENAMHSIPFGDVCMAADGSLRAACYAIDKTTRAYAATMFRSDDDGATWTIHAPLAQDHGETALLHLGDGKWLAASRRQVAGTPTSLLRSADDGKTWTLAEELISERDQHSADFLRLSDGRLMLAFGVRQAGKCGVAARVSDDDGATWGPTLTVVDDCTNADCGYPSSAQSADGSIVTGFYAAGTPQYADYQFATVVWRLPPKK